jgi:hypothetical protein
VQGMMIVLPLSQKNVSHVAVSTSLISVHLAFRFCMSKLVSCVISSKNFFKADETVKIIAYNLQTADNELQMLMAMNNGR